MRLVLLGRMYPRMLGARYDDAEIEDMRAPIEIVTLEQFDVAFGELGAKVGPRTGPHKRTQDEKEWYVLRRFLKEGVHGRRFKLPLVVRKGVPPEPDFVIEGPQRALIEITEATSEADQREMTRQEFSDRAILLGELGGRFEGGGGEPGHLWASDIVEAIKRKKNKSIFSCQGMRRHLVIYPNSNASALLFSDKDERRAFALLVSLIDPEWDELSRVANGCSVHILGKDYVFSDVLARATRRRRRFSTIG
jgi:hypothetical protein